MTQSEPERLQLSYEQALQIAQALEEQAWSEDPVAWMQDVQDKTADDWQATVLDSPARQIILNCCRQSGKTEIAAFKAVHAARYTPDIEVLVCSATLRQAGILQRRVNYAMSRAYAQQPEWIEDPKFKDFKLTEWDETNKQFRIVRHSALYIELDNRSRVISAPASPETVRGYSPNIIIVDEDAFVQDGAYKAIRPMRAAKPVQLILMSTPFGKRGHFYEIWKNASEWDGKAGWLKVQVTADDCPRITEEFLADERAEPGVTEDTIQQEYYCKFLDVHGGVFTEDEIAAMFNNPYAGQMREQWEEEADPFSQPYEDELDMIQLLRESRERMQ